MRGVPQDWRGVGQPAHGSEVRQGGLLRQLAQPPRLQARRRGQPSLPALHSAGRGLELVRDRRSRLRRRGVTKYLPIYLNDHLAAAVGAVQLARRAAGQNEGTEYGEALAGLAGEIGRARVGKECRSRWSPY